MCIGERKRSQEFGSLREQNLNNLRKNEAKESI